MSAPDFIPSLTLKIVTRSIEFLEVCHKLLQSHNFRGALQEVMHNNSKLENVIILVYMKIHWWNHFQYKSKLRTSRAGSKHAKFGIEQTQSKSIISNTMQQSHEFS